MKQPWLGTFKGDVYNAQVLNLCMIHKLLCHTLTTIDILLLNVDG